MNYKLIKVTGDFDIRKDFWKDNYQIAHIPPFKKLYDRDATENKEVSSKELWCIWLWCDVSYENKIYRLQEKDKRTAILSYFPKFDFKDPAIKKCIEQYSDLCLTTAARAFKAETDSLVKRSEFFNTADYTLPEPVLDQYGKQVFAAGRPVFSQGTAKDLDSMRKSTLNIMRMYEQVKVMFEEEQGAEIRIHGGGSENLMEGGGLMELDDED